MSNAAPNDPRPTGEPGSGDEFGSVESCVGDNVITIIADDGGDNTIGPAPEHVRKYLADFRRRMQMHPPEQPADS
jgi:hypothetical protein